MTKRIVKKMCKEKVTIVIALYRPNLIWLEEELCSIQKQTYQDFKVIAWNDDPDDKIDYIPLFEKCLKEIPFQIFQGDTNLGSNKVFEILTRKVDTPYIAYCDQDDIWLPDKLEILLALLNNKNVSLAFSDMIVIDENSQVIADSITKIRTRQILHCGSEAIFHLLVKNFVTGCTMILRSDVAKKAIPFPELFFHDWWLAIYAAINGDIVLAPKPLMKYRVYGGNQSGILKGISDKESYFKKYIVKYDKFITMVSNRCNGFNLSVPYQSWSKARIVYFHKQSLSNAIRLLKMKKLVPTIVYFELLLPFIPEYFFKMLIKKIQNDKVSDRIE